VDIRPEHGTVLLRRFKGKEVIVSDFIPPHIFEQMREKAYLYKPNGYTIEEYDRHIAMAIEKSKEIYRTEWCKNPINVRQRKKQCNACCNRTSSTKERLKERCLMQTAEAQQSVK
jgi:hypothetical protein